MQTGQILAELRKTRRLSQLDLALRAEVSSRHLSFIETGRSQASASMLKRLAMELELSCRDTNRLLLSAGYAPAFSNTDLDSDAMAPVRQALEIMLVNHNPFPAVVLDAHWNVLMANQAQQQLMSLMMQERGPFPQTANVVELVFHPRATGPFWSIGRTWRAFCYDACTGTTRRDRIRGWLACSNAWVNWQMWRLCSTRSRPVTAASPCWPWTSTWPGSACAVSPPWPVSAPLWMW